MQDILMTDSELVHGLQTGDEVAFEQIYERYWSVMYRIAISKIQSSDDAKEIVQDIFLDLWQKRSYVQIAELEYYLKRSVKYKTIDYFKREVIRQAHGQFVVDTTSEANWDTEHELAFNDLRAAFLSCIEAMPPKTKDIFILSRIEHKSIEEISGMMEMPIRTVEYHITIGLKALRLHLKDYLIYTLLISVLFDQ